jgi:hypothetical protein
MMDIIITGIIVFSALVFIVFKILKNVRRQAGSSSCGCSGGDCAGCKKIGEKK